MQTNVNVLSGDVFAGMIRTGAANLNSYRDTVNELNVFPIPDGDTGDNMFMTIDTGSTAIGESRGETLDAVSSRAARGMLLGARGNSGVILSRIFAGIAGGFRDVGEADVTTLGKAFEMGVTEAYRAVSVPVEGTILTVYKDAVRYANQRIRPDTSFEEYFRNLTQELRASLDRTPELLEVLKQAGVVDSGGAGLMYIAEGMLMALEGRGVSADTDAGSATVTQQPVDISLFTEDSVLEFGYCTEFLLRLTRSKCDIDAFDLDGFIAYLESVGESVVAFRDGSIVKVHVHSMDPGAILSYCRRYGEYLTVKVENMSLQHNEKNERAQAKALNTKKHKQYGFVACAAGNGIKQLFSSLGVDAVVDGGQSMNPSAQDFIEAFESINADTIFVFPNNSNVVLTAKQASGLYDRASVRVIPSKTIGEGYAAMSMCDTAMTDADELEAMLLDAAGDVITGAVARANRDTVSGDVEIKQNDYIGFVGDTIYCDNPSRSDAVIQLARKLNVGRHDVVILCRGAGVPDGELDTLIGALGQEYRRTEFIPVEGDQPVLDYLMIVE